MSKLTYTSKTTQDSPKTYYTCLISPRTDTIHILENYVHSAEPIPENTKTLCGVEIHNLEFNRTALRSSNLQGNSRLCSKCEKREIAKWDE